MSFFWPTSPNPAIGPFGRFGRLVHWAAILLALFFGLMFSDGGSYATGVTIGVAIAMIGRGLRYVLAAE